MLTEAQTRAIQRNRKEWSQEMIREFDQKWDTAVQRVRDSGMDLSRIPIHPVDMEYRKGGA